MQATLTLEAKKLNLLQAIMSADVESVIDKMTKYYNRITKLNADETLMSEKEFYAKIDRSIAQSERGEFVAMAEGQSVEDFINNL